MAFFYPQLPSSPDTGVNLLSSSVLINIIYISTNISYTNKDINTG
ncbi:hypothetical protein EDWATA_01120 [Edwardsiella tarda ATCC 23685]|uniref:Uncharacterized protein n=1 Tax=Edwardsiella tarda ATCC 23685 TaxID=500638 RepID=D4F318_EDWTA|nr:hypothetical protein EDWATA_01120 [Edwardsiella tarda ATCC 23685]